MEHFESSCIITFYRVSVAKKRIYFVDTVTFKIIVDANHVHLSVTTSLSDNLSTEDNLSPPIIQQSTFSFKDRYE